MNKESNIFKNVISVLLALLVLALAAGTMSASTQAGTTADLGLNVTINATNATGINASVNTIAGANITVYFTNTNTSATTWNINATNLSVSINGSGSPYGTIVTNGAFTMNSSVPTPWFNVTVTNADNSSENATLTRFFFAVPVNLGTAATFAILSSTYTDGGTTTMNGDVGNVAGTGPTILNGTLYATGVTYTQAGSDQVNASSALNSQPCTFSNTTPLFNLATDTTHGTTGVYTPGVYCITGAATTGTGITLNGTGRYIFRSTGALNTVDNGASVVSVALANGASASDVFWTPTGATTLAANARFNGTVIQQAADITTGNPTNWIGRALNYLGAVTTGVNTVITSPSYSGGVPPSFVTANPIRALTRSGAATRYPTSVYYYYNGSNISINVSLNQPGLNVSGNFANVDNASTINTTSYIQNGSDVEYIYTLNATAGNVVVGVKTVTITATNTSGASNSSVFIALMNFNPLVFEPTLGGTNWITDIEDFTNATLTFEKYNDTAHTSKIGKLEFLNPMNLANNTTAIALQNLGTNLNMSATSMSLNSTVDALAAMNVSSRLSAYNLTAFTTQPAIFVDGALIALPNQSLGGNASDISWDQSGHNLNLTVSHWTSYSWGTFGINLTNISARSNTTAAGTNATYNLSLQNNGTVNDTYSLAVVNTNSASTANLSVASLFVVAGTTETFRL
ncbi:MAG: ice-binding family protein, partial [Candidatus Methanoperedens sp.]